MKLRHAVQALLVAVALLLGGAANAQRASSFTLYFYREGQAVPVQRAGILTGDDQADAETLLEALLAGPTGDERAGGLTSPLPPDAKLAAVIVAGDEVTVDLDLPLDFLRGDLDPFRSDAIVEQIVKTLHPLGLHHVHVRAEDEGGAILPISAFLPRPAVPAPGVPPNDDGAPDRPGSEPSGVAQAQGALAGKAVWLSAGHGWYWSETLGRWTTQRGNNHGLVEDFSNAEAVNYYLARYLSNAGADVWLVRERAMTEHEVIVDNDGGSPGYTETGSWLTSSTPGYQGGTYRWANTFDTLSATATWTPDLPQAGRYAVWTWYREGTNRPTDARYEVHHAGGVTTVRLSQEVHGRTWRYLGEFYFQSGTAGHVTLLNASDDPAQAVIADAIRFGGGLGSIEAPAGSSIEAPAGASGEPRWEEAAKYWAQYQGAPPEVYGSDVTARPLYAEWEAAKGYPGEAANAVYVSWHTNAGGGTGTDSFVHDTEPTTGSLQLQDWVHDELIYDLRHAWNPEWVNRGQKSADFGELRELSTIPGVLLEVAFHDTEDPGDADDLREPHFRQIAARAVYQGIAKYHAQREAAPVYLLPEPPQRLAVRTTASGQVTLTWAPPPCCDGVLGDAATGYRVYHSADGRAFDGGTETLSPTLVLPGLLPGSLHFFRVTALNPGGESFPSPVVAVRLPEEKMWRSATLPLPSVASPKGGEPAPSPPGGRHFVSAFGGDGVRGDILANVPTFLVVDGFDRLDAAALVPQWESPFLGTAQRMFLERMNRYDHAVEHAQALDACGWAFDGAVNEAVAAGDVALSAYPAVDWFVGEDAAADAALDDAERALLASYLDGGGGLLLSGSEIGYDLVESDRDPDFYGDYLRAVYLGDDADTYDFAGLAGGPFSGLAGRFDAGSEGAYDVGWPDRLAASGGSTVTLSYLGGTGDGAAVTYDGAYRLVHVGFPLETVTDPLTRTALFCAAADYLLAPRGPGLSFVPSHSGVALAGQTATYTHTLTNLGPLTDTFQLSHASSRGWTVTHTPALTLGAGLSATLAVQVAVPADALSGTVEATVLTATSQLGPTVWAAVTDTTTAVQPAPVPLACRPRLIDPGFEQGPGQSAWQVSAPEAVSVLVSQDDLPAGVQPHGGEWLAWLSPTLSETVALTQVVALPPGELTSTLSLAWLVDTDWPNLEDWASLQVYDLGGALQTTLLTVTGEPLTDTWFVSEFDVGEFAGQTLQLVVHADSRATHFFVDDVNLTTCGPLGADEFRALWVDAYHDGAKTPQQIDELVETARAGNFNALVVQVRRRGDTYYPSALDPWAPDADPGFDALAHLIQRAHAAGLEVHAWATTLAIWGGDGLPAAADHAFNVHGPGATGRDYWLMTSFAGEDKPGGEIYYLDPGHPDVVDYTVAVYAELAANYDLDGLHLDRVRYPEPQGAYCQGQDWYCQDWGYNPTSVARFQAEKGRADPSTWRPEGRTSGQSVPDPLDEAWVQWRRDRVTALVRRIYLAVTALNPELRVSAALSTVGYAPTEAFGWETRSPYRQQLQDWRGWLAEGSLDVALPMTYRDEDTDAAQFDAWVEWQRDHQYGRATVVGTGLFLNDVAGSLAQWQRLRAPSGGGNQALGLAGYSYATPSRDGTSRRAFANAAVTAVLTRPASTTPLPWKDAAALGHLMGTLAQPEPCASLDGLFLTLSGPQTRTLTTDGSGWFGAIDLPPGEYLLSTEVPSTGEPLTSSVSISAGAVSSQTIVLPSCQVSRLYLPLVVKTQP